MCRLFRFVLKISVLIAIFISLTAAVALAWVYYLVVMVPCSETTPERIAAILGRESPIYYRDGQEKVGVLFQDIHRQYVSYAQIPPLFVQAIIAAEDGEFFHHYGIHLPGIARALVANYKAGRIVQGGSTITQQTAKNLFNREGRTYQEKLKEMLLALRLEHRFSKEEILEFYSNQFYVSGTGHGLGVAARYYFDKKPDELSLLEAAFIAGSVKQPNLYNPFIKRDREAAGRAKRLAEGRAHYVLGRMLHLNRISAKEYEEARQGEIMFNQGRTTFALNSIMDVVQEGLASKVISEALHHHGIDNVSTSGVKIITTVDQQLQTESLYALQQELSRLDVRLRGYERKEVQEEYKDIVTSSELSIKGFLFGTIKEINTKDAKSPVITVEFGSKQADGFIDRPGLERVLEALVKYRRNPWATVEARDLNDLLDRLKVGDRVYVSVREIDFFDGTATLDLERYPRLQGAALIIQHGMIRALVGGMENRFFNRAIDAKRLMGSTLKPFLYAAALQLGWHPLDQLDNRRNVFPFRNQAYFPRPDHKPNSNHISMSWAGVKSENLASVWLMYHLTDWLTFPQVVELATALDMVPRLKADGTEETSREFSARLRDQFGIRLTTEILDQAAYERAIQRLETDFLFEGRLDEHRRWRDIAYGLNYNRFRSQIANTKGLDAAERGARLSLLRRSYLDLQRVQEQLQKYREHLEKLPQSVLYALFEEEVPEVQEAPPGSLAEDQQGRLIYTMSSRLPEQWRPVDEFTLRRRLAGLFASERDLLWNNILLEGLVSSGGLSLVRQQMATERAHLDQYSPYSLEVLATVRDYRVMLGLQYLVRLARATGVTSDLEAVLSFPLGSNVISLLDSVRMYETLVTGRRYYVKTPHLSSAEQDKLADEQAGMAIIERIEAPDGKIIYARQTTAQQVFDTKTSNEVAHILQNTIRHGTGRYAWEQVRLHSDTEEHKQKLRKLSLPLMGKTGTANEFRNASFMGYIPTGLSSDSTGLALLPKAGYAAGVYVGFDNNDPMRKGATRISGSQGSLPTWSGLASALYQLEGVANKLDLSKVDTILPLQYPETDQIFFPVEHTEGIPQWGKHQGGSTQSSPSYPSVLSHGTQHPGGYFERERRFMPFWIHQE
jgi:penicillin-binding protein 1A